MKVVKPRVKRRGCIPKTDKAKAFAVLHNVCIATSLDTKPLGLGRDAIAARIIALLRSERARASRGTD